MDDSVRPPQKKVSRLEMFAKANEVADVNNMLYGNNVPAGALAASCWAAVAAGCSETTTHAHTALLLKLLQPPAVSKRQPLLFMSKVLLSLSQQRALACAGGNALHHGL